MSVSVGSWQILFIGLICSLVVETENDKGIVFFLAEKQQPQHDKSETQMGFEPTTLCDLAL